LLAGGGGGVEAGAVEQGPVFISKFFGEAPLTGDGEFGPTVFVEVIKGKSSPAGVVGGLGEPGADEFHGFTLAGLLFVVGLAGRDVAAKMSTVGLLRGYLSGFGLFWSEILDFLGFSLVIGE